MDQSTKDLVDLLAKSIGAIGVALAAVGLYLNWRVRREDLRWRKATATRDALADIHRNPYAFEAVNMADAIVCNETYVVPKALSDLGSIPIDAIDAHLRGSPQHHSLTPDQIAFVRRCFDWFLYYVDRVAYLAGEGMLEQSDFDASLQPYAAFVADRWPYFQKLAQRSHYPYLITQVARLSERSKSSVTAR